MAVTVFTSVQLEPISCYSCGVIFGMPAEMDRDRRQDRKSFWCPNGHAQSYIGKTEAEKERERAQKAEERSAALIAQLDQERASHSATKGQLTKTKKRIANGVCPCCHRSFVQLARHMKGQHPKYTEVPA